MGQQRLFHGATEPFYRLKEKEQNKLLRNVAERNAQRSNTLQAKMEEEHARREQEERRQKQQARQARFRRMCVEADRGLG